MASTFPTSGIDRELNRSAWNGSTIGNRVSGQCESQFAEPHDAAAILDMEDRHTIRKKRGTGLNTFELVSGKGGYFSLIAATTNREDLTTIGPASGTPQENQEER